MTDAPIHIKLPPAAKKYAVESWPGVTDDPREFTGVDYPREYAAADRSSPTYTGPGYTDNPGEPSDYNTQKKEFLEFINAPPQRDTLGVSPPLTPKGQAIYPEGRRAPVKIKLPPAAPRAAPTMAERHPLGVGDVHDRLVAVELHLRDLTSKIADFFRDVDGPDIPPESINPVPGSGPLNTTSSLKARTTFEPPTKMTTPAGAVGNTPGVPPAAELAVHAKTTPSLPPTQ